jgi:hypothetical protein
MSKDVTFPLAAKVGLCAGGSVPLVSAECRPEAGVDGSEWVPGWAEWGCHVQVGPECARWRHTTVKWDMHACMSKEAKKSAMRTSGEI